MQRPTRTAQPEPQLLSRLYDRRRVNFSGRIKVVDEARGGTDPAAQIGLLAACPPLGTIKARKIIWELPQEGGGKIGSVRGIR